MDSTGRHAPAPPRSGEPARAVIVMGVSGSGKSSVGRLLAERLDARFIDADDLHPAVNKEKMARGIPLVDADRLPWLAIVADAAAEVTAGGRTVVIACSALRRRYRDVFATRLPTAALVHLDGDLETIRSRISQRQHEFMPVSLLDSQFQALEPPGPEENCLRVNVRAPLESIVQQILDQLKDG